MITCLGYMNSHFNESVEQFYFAVDRPLVLAVMNGIVLLHQVWCATVSSWNV